jgi:hypothetical protein
VQLISLVKYALAHFRLAAMHRPEMSKQIKTIHEPHTAQLTHAWWSDDGCIEWLPGVRNKVDLAVAEYI